MAIKLDAERLANLGYRSLTRTQADKLLAELYDAGQEIVGLKLASEMSEGQLDAFEGFMDANDEPGALAWLERNFPKYREVVEETFAALDEVLSAAVREARQDPLGYQPGPTRATDFQIPQPPQIERDDADLE